MPLPSTRPGSPGPGGPRPSLRFRDRSIFEGVARREIGSIDVMAHSIAVLVPSLTALGSGLAFPTLVGPGFWLSTLLGFGVVGLLAMTFNQFASRFASAGTLYTFVAKGLGPTSALMVAGGLVLGYAAMIGFGLSDAAGRADSALSSAGLGATGASRATVLFVIGALMCLYAIGRGIHWSTRSALVAEAASLGVLVLVLLTWTGRYGFPTWQALSLDGASPIRILVGASFIVTLTLAFESSASLSLETKLPFREVPFSLRSSLALAAVLFAVANVVATTRPADAPSVWSWRWFAPGADHSVADALVLVVLAWSLVALALCVWCALARLLFSLAREGVLPSALGRVTGRGIPMVAALAVVPLALTPPLVAELAGTQLASFAWELKTSAGVVVCTAYALTAASLPRFLHSIDELSPGPVTAAVVAGCGAAAVAITELVDELRHGTFLALALLVGSGAVGLLMHRRARRAPRHEDRYVGMHDEALVSAVVLPPDASSGARDER